MEKKKKKKKKVQRHWRTRTTSQANQAKLDGTLDTLPLTSDQKDETAQQHITTVVHNSHRSRHHTSHRNIVTRRPTTVLSVACLLVGFPRRKACEHSGMKASRVVETFRACRGTAHVISTVGQCFGLGFLQT